MEAHSEQAVVTVEDAESAPQRLPALGTLGALAPPHTSPFAIETNVSRIASQIAEGRKPTYD